jgi:LCP family protein required for cell wall assembly
MSHVSDESGNARNPRRWRGLVAAIVILVVVAGALLGAALWYVRFPGEGSYFSVLLVGEDRDYARNGEAIASAGRMDAIMLLIVPRRDKAALLVSIPRDSLVRFPGGGRRRINSATATGGMDLARQVVSELVGLDVHRHASVNFAGFIEIVDAVGGVDITVDRRMKYTDHAGGYSIALEPGAYHMDGEMALSYVRYRYDALGDISRTARQQEFFRALLDELASWRGIRSIEKIVKIAQDNTNTDLSVREMAAVGWRLRRLDSSALQSTTLPGHFKGAYWEPDYEAIHALVEPLGR